MNKFFKAQQLTDEQYIRANRLLLFTLLVNYAFTIYIDINNTLQNQKPINTLNIIWYSINVIILLVTYKLMPGRKITTLIYAAMYMSVFMVAITHNGPGTLAMSFPVLVAFMVFLNSRIVFIGTFLAFAGCAIQAAIFKSQGDYYTFNVCNSIAIAMILAMFGSNRSTNLLIEFDEDNKKVIVDKVKQQEKVAEDVKCTVDDIASDFTKLINESGLAKELIRDSINTMSAVVSDTENNSKEINNQAQLTSEIQNKITHVDTIAKEATDTAIVLKNTITEGIGYSKDLHDQSKVLDASTNAIVSTVDDLIEGVGRVSSITDAIIKISSQTNLLALNASIEAARAGEAGRGFAVVAEQIRLLAEETKNSTEQIIDIVQELTSASDRTKKEVTNSVEVVEIQKEKVDNIYSVFKNIGAGIDNLHNGIVNITEEVDVVLDANTEIVSGTDVLSSSSEEIVSELGNTVDSINQVQENIILITDIINETSSKLNDLVQKTS